MKLVIFDFDGVLVDTLSVCFSLNAEIHNELTLEEYKSFFKGNIYSAVRSDGTSKSYRPDFDEQYTLRTRELKVPEELKRLLQNLSSEYTLVIVSSTLTSSIKNILKREDTYSYFSDILGSDVHQSKVIKIKMLLEKYGINPEDTVFITDNVGDIMEAKECNVRAIAVTWGFHDKETLQKENPAKIVSTPEELLKAVKEIINA